MSFKIVRNDITKMTTEAIVNTANAEPVVGAGCDSAVYKAAGFDELLAYRKDRIGSVPEGDVFLTPGFALPAKYIIHAVSPLYRDGGQQEEEKLRSCYRKSLALAAQHGIRSVAFPLIATGSFGYPREEGMRIAIDEIHAFLLTHEMEIILVVFGESAVRMGRQIDPDLESYIDRNYVSRKTEEEYGSYNRRPRPGFRPAAAAQPSGSFPAPGAPAPGASRPGAPAPNAPASGAPRPADAAPRPAGRPRRRPSSILPGLGWFKKDTKRTEEAPFDDAALEKAATCDEPFESGASGTPAFDGAPSDSTTFESRDSGAAAFDGAPSDSATFECAAPGTAAFDDSAFEELENRLNERMKHMSDTFSQYLLFLIREKGLENADVYKSAIVDKKVFSKIKNHPDYHPQKLTALCLCIGARLNLDETRDLLARAGYALSPCDKTDIIFSYFIENHIYDMIELDIRLEEHGLPCVIS